GGARADRRHARAGGGSGPHQHARPARRAQGVVLRARGPRAARVLPRRPSARSAAHARRSEGAGQLNADALALGVEIGAAGIGEVERPLLGEHLEIQAAAEPALVPEARPRFTRNGAAAIGAAESPAVHDPLLEIDAP